MKEVVSVEFNSNRDEYEDALDEVALKVLTYWGLAAEDAAKRLAPVDTGLLRNSITWAIAGGEANTKEYEDNKGKQHGEYDGQAPDDDGPPRSVHIGSNVEYAIRQECGSSKGAGHPFLRPAIDENKDYYKEILEGELQKALQND